jgi:hypothetical protein
MIRLDLIEVNAELRATAAKAVRAAMAAAGIESGMETVREAIAVVDRVRARHGPQTIVSEADGVSREAVLMAGEAFKNATGGHACGRVAVVSFDPDAPTALDVPREDTASDVPLDQRVTSAMLEPIPANFTPGREGALTMALLIGMCDGNAAAAFSYARRLAVTTGHPDVYIDVMRAICVAYNFKPAALGEAS